ncbi:MAG: Fic family protein [Bacillota bacterium]|nr:Fic family protein [Bacillota bacterium]
MSAYEKITTEYTPEEKRSYWQIGIGLQAVDGLKPSGYLIEQQEQEIAGKLTLEEVKRNLDRYYELRKNEADLSEKEADLTSARINEYLRQTNFRLHPLALKQIHRFIFQGLEDFAPGEYRTYNISKQEPILFGRSVRYEDFQNIEAYLEYDFSRELKRAETRDKIEISQLSDFIAGLWQIHPFREGNTRTIAVFTIQYLNSLGFQINNEPFQKHAAYFRDALVRASYNNMEHGVSPDFQYIDRFLENVLHAKEHLLDSEELIVAALAD